MMAVTDFKLVVKDADAKWTEVAKQTINAIIDYASKINRFSTVRIGGHMEMDEAPGFYITFPGLDDQDRISFDRTENTFRFRCVYKVKGSDYQEALEELLELHGALLAKMDTDPNMAGVPQGVPEVGVPSVYNVEFVGLVTEEGTGTSPNSFEYLYGATTIICRAKINLRG